MVKEQSFPITNQNLSVKYLECVMPSLESSNMKCEFTDEQDIKKEVDNVVFFNFEVPASHFEMHRHIDTGETVISAKDNHPIWCEIMGENQRGLTVNCRDGANGI